MSEPLAAADAAWLRMERPESPMVVHGFFEFGEPLSLGELHRVLEERLLAEPRFRQRVMSSALTMGRPWWKTEPFLDLEYHVQEVTVGQPEDFGSLVDEIVSTPLDFGRPLWRATLVHGAGPGSTVVFSIHHAVADGIALLRVLLSLCEEAGESGSDQAAAADRRGPLQATAAALRKLADPVNLVRFPFAVALSSLTVARLVLLPKAADTPLTRDLGGSKRTAWTRSFALAAIKAAAKRRDVTINDVMTAAVVGALGTYLGQNAELNPDLVLRAMVPVNVRPLDRAPAMGNYFGLVLPALPVGERDARLRLAAVKDEMDRIKASPEPAVTFGILRTIGMTTAAVHRLVVDFFAHKSSAVLTNVPGPQRKLSFAGVPLESLMFWVPQGGGLGLGISILSYAGGIGVGVISDVELVPDPHTITCEIEREIELLLR